MSLLIDGNHLSSRARFARVNELVTSDGRPSGVIYGFLRGLLAAAHEVGAHPEETTVVWDYGRAKFRKELLPTYKKRYSDTPTPEEKAELEDYFSQLDAIRECLAYIGVRSIRVRGAEADDLISILAHLQEMPCVIYSGDKDFHQIVSRRVMIYDAVKGFIDEEAVLSRWGVSAIRRVLYLRAMVGDESDKVPGISGIGEKRAALVIEAPQSAKAAKWVELCRQNMDIILRNLEIMRLPKTLVEARMDEEQMESLISQMSVRVKKNLVLFMEFCKRWELKELARGFNW